MSTLTIDLSPETYQRLEEQARRAGQAPETLSREILETALEMRETAKPRTTREVLQTAGSTRSLSPTLRSRIIPGVTLMRFVKSLRRRPVRPWVTSFASIEVLRRDRLLPRCQCLGKTLR